MALTLVGFAEDIDLAGTEQGITALADDHLFISGDNIRVPDLNQIVAVWGGLGSGGDGLMSLEAPSIRDSNRHVVSPLNHLADSDCEPSDPIAWQDLSSSPLQLTTDELLTITADSDTGSAAFQWCFIEFGDGAPQPVSSPNMFTAHATGSTTVTARAWSSVDLTFRDSLLFGDHAVVGLRAQSATLIAARLIFRGRNATSYRPGVPGVDSGTSMLPDFFRRGNSGTWGVFNSTQPPLLEVLCGSADSSQVVELDLIPV